MSSFRFLHHNATTYAKYDHELLSLQLHNGSAATSTSTSSAAAEARAQGITFVLASLTPNHRKVLEVLARAQLENTEKNGKIEREISITIRHVECKL